MQHRPTTIAIKHGIDAVNKTSYNPRAMKSLLHQNYGANNVYSFTLLKPNERMVHIAEKRHPVTDVVYDLKENPIFDSLAVFDIKLPSDWALSVKTGTHKSAATKELAKAIESKI